MTTYVAMGDSFTAGTDPSGTRWPDELARSLGGRYVNLAEVGATSEQVETEQLERALELSPDVVTLVCGANDVLLNTRPDADAYAERLSRMFTRLRREHPDVMILTATYPDISRFLDLRPRSQIRVERGMTRFNAACRAIARRHKVVVLEGFDHPVTEERSSFAADGFHLGPEGHRAAAREFLRALRAAPPPAPGYVTTTIVADLFGSAFHQIQTGDRFTTPEREIGERDILDFAALTGDSHPQHVDPEWAAESRFGEQIAHGLLVLSFAVGLLPLDPDRVVALRRVGDAVFKQPVRIGDTLHVEGEITGTRELDAEHGLVEARLRIVNQHGRLAVRATVELVWRA